METGPEPLFPLGQVVATQAALKFVPNSDIELALFRHKNGDWGTVGKEDWDANNLALVNGTRLLSVYKPVTYPNAPKFWIITEADRSVTTILLPEDY